MKKEYLECGKVCSAHGVRGTLKIEHWCDSPKVLAGAKRVFTSDGKGGYKEFKIKSASVSTKFVLLTLDGVDTREDAQTMKNEILYLHRTEIPVPQGAVFIADMIGLPVIDEKTGRIYGTLAEVNDGVQGKLYTVATKTGNVIFPGIPEFVKEIDTERGVFIRTIPGFFEEE